MTGKTILQRRINKMTCSDVAPEGKNLAETNALLDKVTDEALKLQKESGIKLLWATCNLFANPR